eukprot:767475-Hanusia_phi.AAC.3
MRTLRRLDASSKSSQTMSYGTIKVFLENGGRNARRTSPMGACAGGDADERRSEGETNRIGREEREEREEELPDKIERSCHANGFFDQVGKRSEVLLRQIPSTHGIEMEMPTTAMEDGSTVKLGSAFSWCPGSYLYRICVFAEVLEKKLNSTTSLAIEVLRDRSEWKGEMTGRLRRTFYNHLFGQTSGLEVVAKSR